jgi:hypothetical protein
MRGFVIFTSRQIYFSDQIKKTNKKNEMAGHVA